MSHRTRRTSRTLEAAGQLPHGTTHETSLQVGQLADHRPRRTSSTSSNQPVTHWHANPCARPLRRRISDSARKRVRAVDGPDPVRVCDPDARAEVIGAHRANGSTQTSRLTQVRSDKKNADPTHRDVGSNVAPSSPNGSYSSDPPMSSQHFFEKSTSTVGSASGRTRSSKSDSSFVRALPPSMPFPSRGIQDRIEQATAIIPRPLVG